MAKKGDPKKTGNGWVVELGDIEFEWKNQSVPAVYLHGHLLGVWIDYAGIEDKPASFALPGDPNFLDTLADAFRRFAQQIRDESGFSR